MAIIIEHEKRRAEILEQSINIFAEEGFENTTFQKIADRCGVKRTTLYVYFKSKQEIFNYSIKRLTQTVEADLAAVKNDASKNCAERLLTVFSVIIDRLTEKRRLLSVILDYLRCCSARQNKPGARRETAGNRRGGASPEKRVRRRTIRIRHILAGLIIEGVSKGELPRSSVQYLGRLLYGLLETAVFRLVVLETASADDLKETARLAVYSHGKSAPPSDQSTY